MSEGRTPGAGDIEFSDHGSAETTGDNLYRLVAIYLDNDGVEDLWKSGDPMTNVATLMKGADDWALQNSSYDQQRLYEAAVQIVIDPAIQLEIGCRLLQRADVPDPPLCEHLYATEPFKRWQPQLVVHDEIGDGPPALDSEGVVHLAREAYANGWFFYSTWATGGSDREWPVYAVTALARSLFALDGLRVCCEYLNDVRNLWLVCNWLNEWFKECNYVIRDVDGDLSTVVADVRDRFAHTIGRLQPMKAGWDQARTKLVREFDWFDLVPQTVADHLVDAEYARLNLRDPKYNPKGIIAGYCMAVEVMLHERLGKPIEAYLRGTSKSERDRFRAAFRDSNDSNRNKGWRPDLTIGQFANNLRQAFFKTILSKIGADSAFYYKDLPEALDSLKDYRNPSSHGGPRVFSEAEIAIVRPSAVEVLSCMARVRVMLQPGSG